MSFNSGEFNTTIKCACVKRFHLCIAAAATAVCTGGEKMLMNWKLFSKKKGFENHIYIYIYSLYIHTKTI